MGRLVRSAMLQLGRRLLVAAMILSATGAILLYGEGTSAQSGANPQVITPVRSATTAMSAKDLAPTPQIAEPPSRAALTTPDAVTAPAAAAPTTARTIAGPASKPKTTSTSPSKSRSSSSPAVVSSAGSAAKTSSAPPSVFQYVGYRDLAPVINPQREMRGWADVTTTVAKTYASCMGDQSGSCAGHVVPCDAPPTGIGTPSTKTISNGQYKDQYGKCLEFMII